ncbi:MAG TPA: autotransporter-associated beta strand repeat-containing protein [Kiritimatiellia bacterium]|nr:autotransporter-associated beta strand repeat-containing protein [Kiritimatiellia bacterium]
MNTKRILAVGVAASLLGTGATFAAILSWTNDAGGLFSDGANWAGGVAPGLEDQAVFTNGGTYTVTLDQSVTNERAWFNSTSGVITVDLDANAWTLTNSVNVGYAQTNRPEVVISSGALTTRSLPVSISNGSWSVLTLQGVTGAVSDASGFNVGWRGGTGAVVVAGGGSSLRMPGGGTHSVGNGAGSVGAVSVIDGFLGVTGTLEFGRSAGFGRLDLAGGTNVVSGALYLGRDAGSRGVLTMTGPGAYLTAGLNMGDASNSVGELYLTNGLLFARGETKLAVYGQSLLVLAGGSFTNDTGNTYLPQFTGTGTLVLASPESTFYLGGALTIGHLATGRGDIIVSNGTFNAASLTLGRSGSSVGSLYLYNGTAVVRNTSANPMLVADGAATTGVVVLADAGALLNLPGNNLAVGWSGNGQLIVSNGKVNVKGLTIASQTGSFGRVVVEQGQLLVPTNGLTIGSSSVGSLTLAHPDAYLENIYATPNTVIGGSVGGQGFFYLSNGLARLRAMQVGGNGVGYVEVGAATLLVDDNLFVPSSTFIQQYGNSADADISFNGSDYAVSDVALTNAWIGNVGGAQTRNVALVFQLPANRPPGSTVNASLSFRLSTTSSTPRNFSVDLYGIRSSNVVAVLTNDYTGGELLQEDILVPSVTNGTLLSTSLDGSAALSAWIDGLYDNGAAANDFIFLGLRFDDTPDESAFYQIHTVNSGAQANRPFVNIGFSFGATGLLAMASEAATVFVSNTVRVGSTTVPASGTILASKGSLTAGSLEVGALGNDTLEIGAATVTVFKTGGNAVKIAQGTGAGRIVMNHGNARLNLPAGELWVGGQGVNGSGALIVSNGQVNAGFLQVARANGSQGRVEIHDGSIVVLTNAFIGNSANSTSLVLLAHANSLLTVSNGAINVGVYSNSLATMILSNGMVRALEIGVASSTLGGTGMVGQLFIHNATYDLFATNVAGNAMNVGGRNGSTGTVVLAHPGARISAAGGGRLYIGNGGVGRLVISNGAVEIAGSLTAADSQPGTAEITVEDGRLTIGNRLILARFGTGTLNVAHANALVQIGTGGLWMADANGSTTGALSTINLSAGTISGAVNSVDHLIGGTTGGAVPATAIINVSGGVLDLRHGNLFLGNRSSTVGELKLSGGTVLVSRLRLPAGGTGESSTGAVVLSGGTLAVSGIESAVKTNSVAARSNLLFSGGTLLARANFTNNLDISLEVAPGPGLVAFDTENFEVIQNGVLSGAGGLAKRGSGDLALSAANPYTGETLVQQGTLALLGSGDIAASTSITLSVGAILDAQLRGDGTLTIGAGQRVRGNGIIAGATVNNGVVAPGLSAGTLGAGGPYSQAGTLEIELAGTVPGTGHDQLEALGAATLGGTLDVKLINAFTPSAGQTFTVLTASAVSGTFATTNLPALGGGLEWDVNYEPTAVVLEVSGTGPVPTPYEDWADLFGLSGTNRNFDADPDGDGYVNLLEYSQGSNPTSGVSTAQLRMTMTNGAARLLLNRVNTATDIVYHVEASYLVTNAIWAGIASNVLGVWSGPAIVDDNNTGLVHEVRVVDPVAGATNRFLRLRVHTDEP